MASGNGAGLIAASVAIGFVGFLNAGAIAGDAFLLLAVLLLIAGVLRYVREESVHPQSVVNYRASTPAAPRPIGVGAPSYSAPSHLATHPFFAPPPPPPAPPIPPLPPPAGWTAPVRAPIAGVPPAAGEKFCTACGSGNQRISSFCHRCGRPLPEAI
ncbi:MAG: hypothetical protein L3K06_04205 [Thermoplasmata archaeon]|nr:hypothetical protein [Thermoplasmata archaeon]